MKLKDLTPVIIEALNLLEQIFDNRDFVHFVKLLLKLPADDAQDFCSTFLCYKDEDKDTPLPNLRTPDMDQMLASLIDSYQLGINAHRIHLMGKIRKINDELIQEEKPYLRDLL